MESKIILVDFDGTCVKHKFPEIGESIGAQAVLRKLVNNGHRLILWTCRDNVSNPTSTDPNIVPIDGNYLDYAVNWFKQNEIELFGINKNPEQFTWSNSPKAYGHIKIDDSAIGCPLIHEQNERPYVDWVNVHFMLDKLGYFNS